MLDIALSLTYILRKMKRSPAPTIQDFQMIAATASCDPRTVAKCYQGESVRALVRFRIERAAAELRLAAPPKEKR